MNRARLLLLTLSALLVLPAAAAADPQYTTLMQSRSDGLVPFEYGAVNTSVASPYGISADGCRVVFASQADGLLPAHLHNRRVQGVYVRDLCADTIHSLAGPTANNDSERPAISPNGRYVAFYSKATNLVSGAPSGSVYVRDLQQNTTKLASRRDGATGVGVVIWGYDPPAVSDTGAVAFLTSEPLDATDTNGSTDVHVRDGDTTTRVSSGRPGGTAWSPSISADGRRVAFQTGYAHDAERDTNTAADVYVHDRDAQTTTLVSRAGGAGTTAAGGTDARVSGDGSAVLFVTSAALDAKDTNGRQDVYHRRGDVTTLVSRRDGADTAAANGQSWSPALDTTGNVVAFMSYAGDLGPEGNVSDADVFVRDLTANTTKMASRLGAAGAAADGESNQPSVSATHVAFQTTSTDLLSTDDDDFARVVRRSLGDATTELASRPAGTGSFVSGVNEATFNRERSGDGHVSADGRHVVFLSRSDSLSPHDDDRVMNVYVRDNVTDTTTLVNRGDAEEVDRRGAAHASISDDGRRVAFTTLARLDEARDVNGVYDLYVRDLDAGTTYLASRPTGAGAQSLGANADEPALSGDGTRVAFGAGASLDAADTNGKRDVYVRDLVTHTTYLASPAGAEPAAGATLDTDGSHVAFETLLAIDPADDNAKLDVYRREVAGAETVLVSRADGAVGPVGDGASRNASISGDGSRIAFATEATNLAAVDTTPRRAVHLRDVAAGQTILISRGAGGGGESDATSDRPSVSTDGRTVAFESDATNLGISNPAGTQSYIRITNTNSTRIASRVTGGANGPTNAPSIRPAVSGNGHCVAFTTRASNIDPSRPASDHAQVYLHAVTADCPDEDPPETYITAGPDGPTSDATPQFAFNADGAATFSCRVDGGDWFACASPEGLPELADGPHAFEVAARDATGNVDPTPARREFVVDTDAPETTVGGPSGRIAASEATFTFGADEQDVRYMCEVDGQGMEDCDPPSKTLDGLGEGAHSFAVVAVDAAGNADPSPATREFEVDLSAPAVTIGAVSAADDGSARVEFATDGATVACAVDGGGMQPCASPLRLSDLAAGEHTVRVQASDELGNAGPVAMKRFVVPAKPAPQPQQPGGPSPDAGENPPAPPGGGQTPGPGAPVTSAGSSAPRVLRTTLKVDRRGRAVLRLACGATPCRGTASVTAKLGKRTVTVARGSYAIAAGRTATLRLRLSAKARRALRSKRSLAAKVTLTGAAAPVKLRLRAA